eukprot:4604584-Heterocapsa_arctica.AAC.1
MLISVRRQSASHAPKPDPNCSGTRPRVALHSARASARVGTRKSEGPSNASGSKSGLSTSSVIRPQSKSCSREH